MSVVIRNDNILARTLRQARESYGLSVRALAERARLSPAQVSRMERGLVVRPALDTLEAVARGLDRNPIPLWIVAHYISGAEAHNLLKDMLREDAEVFDEWVDEAAKKAALNLLKRPAPPEDEILELAAKVFLTFETEETLWESYALSANGRLSPSIAALEDRRVAELVGIVRDLPRARFAKVLEYAKDQFTVEYGRPFVDTEDLPAKEGVAAMGEVAAASEEMHAFTRTDLEARGFMGFVTVRHLLSEGCGPIPSDAGVYVVLRAQRQADFRSASQGGHFKRKDPTVSLAILKERWIEDSDVLYVGKGDNIRRRVKQLIEFGAGKPVGHWGGRYVWQLSEADHLLIAWKVGPTGVTARAMEIELLEEFESRFGRLPFANLAR